MGYYARNKGTAFVEDNYKQKADSCGIANLKQGRHKVGTIQQVDDVTYSKGDRAYDYCTFNIGFFHHTEQEAAEDNLLDKADVKHGQNMKGYLACGVVDVKSVP